MLEALPHSTFVWYDDLMLDIMKVGDYHGYTPITAECPNTKYTKFKNSKTSNNVDS